MSKGEKMRDVFKAVMVCVVAAHAPIVGASNCSSSEYQIYQKYDAFLDAYPNIPDSDLRQVFSRKVGMKPSALKDLYLRCSYASVDQTPSKSAANLNKTSSTAESSKTKGRDCYQIGYRYTKCALATKEGFPCPAEWDFAVPDRCKQSSELNRGIKEGTEDFYQTMKESGRYK